MRVLPLAFCAALLPQIAMAEGKSIIVLDASGSMWGQIEGRAKLEIAREALGSVLSGMDPATEVGLMAYGHRSKGDCADIELVVPPGPGTAQSIIDAANAMKFLGENAAVRCRAQGRGRAALHRRGGDGDPDHRRDRDLQRRPLRAGDRA